MRHKTLFLLATVSLASWSLATAEVITPARPVTSALDITSPENPAAKAIPLEDLISTRGILAAAWSTDGRQLFFSTNLTGRYNVWRVDAAGSAVSLYT